MAWNFALKDATSSNDAVVWRQFQNSIHIIYHHYYRGRTSAVETVRYLNKYIFEFKPVFVATFLVYPSFYVEPGSCTVVSIWAYGALIWPTLLYQNFQLSVLSQPVLPLERLGRRLERTSRWKKLLTKHMRELKMLLPFIATIRFLRVG